MVAAEECLDKVRQKIIANVQSEENPFPLLTHNENDYLECLILHQERLKTLFG